MYFHCRFILQDLDELHVFVALDVAKQLQQKIDELMEKNSYSEFDQQNKGKWTLLIIIIQRPSKAVL